MFGIDSFIDTIHRPAPVVKASQEELEGPPMIKKVDLPPGAEIIIRERDLEGRGLLVQPVTAVERGLSEGAASIVCKRGKIVGEGPIEPFLAEDGQFVAIRPFPKKPYPNPNVFRVCVEGNDEVLIEGYEGPEITRAIEPLTAVRIKDPDLAVQAQGVINSDRPVVGKPLPPDLESLVYSVLVANIPVTEEVLAGQKQEPFKVIYQGTRARIEEIPQKVEAIPTLTPEPTKPVEPARPPESPEPPEVVGPTAAKVGQAAEEAPVATTKHEFGVTPILELASVKRDIETFVDTKIGREAKLMSQTITPFMGLDYGSKEKSTMPPVLVIGYTVDGQVKEFKRVGEENEQSNNDPVLAWQALQVLSQLRIIKHSTLYDVLHVIPGNIDNSSVRDTRSDMGKSADDFQKFIASISAQILPPSDEEKILTIMVNNGIIIGSVGDTIGNAHAPRGPLSNKRGLLGALAPKGKAA
jgi:hypothetical protein